MHLARQCYASRYTGKRPCVSITTKASISTDAHEGNACYQAMVNNASLRRESAADTLGKCTVCKWQRTCGRQERLAGGQGCDGVVAGGMP